MKPVHSLHEMKPMERYNDTTYPQIPKWRCESLVSEKNLDKLIHCRRGPPKKIVAFTGPRSPPLRSTVSTWNRWMTARIEKREWNNTDGTGLLYPSTAGKRTFSQSTHDQQQYSVDQWAETEKIRYGGLNRIRNHYSPRNTITCTTHLIITTVYFPAEGLFCLLLWTDLPDFTENCSKMRCTDSW